MACWMGGLYDALAGLSAEVIECFPDRVLDTHGARDGRSRAVWTCEALAALELPGVPTRTNQDMRQIVVPGSRYPRT